MVRISALGPKILLEIGSSLVIRRSLASGSVASTRSFPPLVTFAEEIKARIESSAFDSADFKCRVLT